MSQKYDELNVRLGTVETGFVLSLQHRVSRHELLGESMMQLDKLYQIQQLLGSA